MKENTKHKLSIKYRKEEKVSIVYRKKLKIKITYKQIKNTEDKKTRLKILITGDLNTIRADTALTHGPPCSV